MLTTKELIGKTREYLDYVDEHIDNVDKAFIEVSGACSDMVVIADDKSFFTLHDEVKEHDLSKLSKEEFTPYREAFYPAEGEPNIKLDGDAWLHHKENNDHHWETIMSKPDALPGVRERHLIHMIIDWTAMSYKFGGSAEEFYRKEAQAKKIVIGESDIAFIVKVFNRIELQRLANLPWYTPIVDFALSFVSFIKKAV